MSPLARQRNRPKRAWGETVGGQAVSIATDKAVYAPEQPISLNVIFQNVGKIDVRAIGCRPLGMYKITVLDSEEKAVPLTRLGKERQTVRGEGSMCYCDMKPGQRMVSRFQLSRLYDFSVPGKYTVFVERYVWEKPDGSICSTARSNRIEVTVDGSHNVEDCGE